MEGDEEKEDLAFLFCRVGIVRNATWLGLHTMVGFFWVWMFWFLVFFLFYFIFCYPYYCFPVLGGNDAAQGVIGFGS
jgi:hypothetical protein